VLGGFRRGAERQDGVDEIGILGAPLKRLAAGHRPAGYQRHAPDAEYFGQQAVLGANIIVKRDLRETRRVIRGRRIAWRGRNAVAEHVDRNDEMARRVDGTPWAEVTLVAPLRRWVPV
jgi:hypothetical protein